jgi:CelD/BcsL family acetyltransferase involved in cellulose biosynthesis
MTDLGVTSPTTNIGLRCEVIRDFQKLQELEIYWDRFWKSDPNAEIFQHFAWNRAWWRAYGDNVELRCVVVWRDGTPIGFLPMVKKDSGLCCMGSPDADYFDLVCEDAEASVVFAAAIGELLKSDDWKECAFEHLSCESRIVAAQRYLPQEFRRHLRLAPARHSATILLNQPALLKGLAEKKHLRRHETKLSKTGPLDFRVVEDEQEILNYLSGFFRDQIRRRALLGETSNCLRSDFASLLEGLVREITPLGQLRFFVLEQAGRPVAYHFGFLTNGKFLMYQQTFDVDAWDSSPGEVLLRHLFLYGDKNVSREFDFSVGYEFFKNRFANHHKENFVLYLAPQGLAGRVKSLFRSAEARFAPAILKAKNFSRTTPSVLRVIRVARQWKAHLRPNQTGKSWREQSPSELFNRIRREPSPIVDDTVRILAARLSDLADLSVEAPLFHVPGRLTTYRQRLAKGDVPYIVKHKNQPTFIAWTSTANDASSPARSIKLGSIWIYECLVREDSEDVTAFEALQALLAEPAEMEVTA